MRSRSSQIPSFDTDISFPLHSDLKLFKFAFDMGNTLVNCWIDYRRINYRMICVSICSQFIRSRNWRKLLEVGLFWESNFRFFMMLCRELETANDFLTLLFSIRSVTFPNKIFCIWLFRITYFWRLFWR